MPELKTSATDTKTSATDIKPITVTEQTIVDTIDGYTKEEPLPTELKFVDELSLLECMRVAYFSERGLNEIRRKLGAPKYRTK